MNNNAVVSVMTYQHMHLFELQISFVTMTPFWDRFNSATTETTGSEFVLKGRFLYYNYICIHVNTYKITI